MIATTLRHIRQAFRWKSVSKGLAGYQSLGMVALKVRYLRL